MSSGRRTGMHGPYTIGGLRDLSFPTPGVALSRALNRCERATDAMQVGVYFNDRQVYRVERHEDRTITVSAVQR